MHHSIQDNSLIVSATDFLNLLIISIVLAKFMVGKFWQYSWVK